MALETEVLNEINDLVRGGFESPDRIVEILSEEMYEPGELDVDEVEEAVKLAIEALEKEKPTWPATTDCDKLDIVFSSLSGKGIIALQYAGYTQSDGYEDVSQAYHEHPAKDSIIGYCFYHGQDLERAVQGGGLYLAFGPMDPKTEQVAGPRIGTLITQELQKHDFAVAWNGTFNQRIHIPDIDWKRR